MTDMIQCPVDGCDYEGAQIQHVKGHWGGKQDAAHTGAFHEAYDATETAETRESQVMGSATPDGGEADQTAEMPCGHAYDPADMPDERPLQVTCGTCGTKYVIRE